MRIVKQAEDRKNEILDAAEVLFGQKGFDGASTNDILQKVNIARGTLYYHFKSKEDILDALIDRYNTRILESAAKVASDKSIPVVERIIRVIMAQNINGGSSQQIMEHIHRPQNALMHQKIQTVMLNGMIPILTEIVKDGIADGTFITPYPTECVEMIMIYVTTVFEDDWMEHLTEEDRYSHVLAFIYNVEKLLGTKEGAFQSMMQLFTQ